MSRIKFLNTYIDSLTVSEAKARVDEMVQKRTPQYVVTPNTDIVMRMQREPDLLEICNKADLILTDGEMLVKLSKFLGNPIKERVAMTDFVWDVCDLAVEKKYRVFLFGGKESVLEKGKERIQNKYLNLNICGHYSPPLGFENNPAAYHCYRAAGFQDVPTEQAEYYHVLGENWKCLEMERTL